MRRVLTVVALVSAAVFIFAFDQWGSTAFLTLVLSAFSPPKTSEKLVHRKIVAGQDFPETFLIGSASSSYQVEGGWNAQGKTPSIWDDFVHYTPNVVIDNSTGDVGCDSFHNYKEDVAALKLVGVRKNQLITFDDVALFVYSSSTTVFQYHGPG